MDEAEAWAELGRRVEAARESAGLSRREAARLAGMSDAYLRQLEAGGRTTGRGEQSLPTHSAEKLVAVAKVVGLAPGPLLRLVGKRTPPRRPRADPEAALDHMAKELARLADVVGAMTAEVERLRKARKPPAPRRKAGRPTKS